MIIPIFSDFSILNIVYWLCMTECSLLTHIHARFSFTLSQYSSIYHKLDSHISIQHLYYYDNLKLEYYLWLSRVVYYD